MKTQIVLPDALGEELKRVIPARQRSRFIAEALGRQLKALKFRKALSGAAGTWTDRNHPDLNTQAGVDRYLSRFRARFRVG